VALWLLSWVEGFDDDHGSAAAGARLAERLWRCIGLVDGRVLRRRDVKQFAGAGEVLGAAAIGKKAIMADTMEARGEHVEEKAADEFGYRQGHGLVQITAFGPVVLILEGDLLVVEGDQAAV
jgi:hypothetical protein